jgi:hypothetical protein
MAKEKFLISKEEFAEEILSLGYVLTFTPNHTYALFHLLHASKHA